MRSFISILLLITLSLEFSIRLTGYLHCAIKIYTATHTGHSINSFEYCECLKYFAYSPDGNTPRDQLHKAPQTGYLSDTSADLQGLVIKIKPLVKNKAELNSLGSMLLSAQEPVKAAMIFRLNAMLYPEEASLQAR